MFVLSFMCKQYTTFCCRKIGCQWTPQVLIDWLLGILNYKWSHTGIYDVYDKGIAGILVGMMAAAGGAYWKSNDKPTAMALGFVAILQGLGVKNGWYDRFA